MQESLLGPLHQELADDVAPGHRIPDLAREHRFFRKGPAYRTGLLELDDAIDFRVIDEVTPVVITEGEHAVVVGLDGDAFVIVIDGDEACRLPRSPPSVERSTGQMTISTEDISPADIAAAIARTQALRFVPPRFGVTVLGRSHGFDPDPKERTTGFVLWIGGRGVMVDPPLDATQLLTDAEIDSDLVDGLILTHVHGDHDAGTLQKALAAGRITLWTTPSIFASWLRKWSALANVPEAQLHSLFDFRPVQIGAPVEVHGARLLFRFTLHSIPALVFEAHYQGASFNYSGDTLNDPAAVDAIFAAGHMDAARREELSHYDWSHDLHFHESGIPPLHTPIERLAALDDDVKKRLRVLHVTPHRVLGHAGLIVAEPGRAATITLPVEFAPEQRLLRNLGLLGRTKLFADLPLAHAAALLTGAVELKVNAGDRLIREGDVGDALYLVTAGKASVQRDGQELKAWGLGDVFGETAVFLRRPRNADVVASPISSCSRSMVTSPAAAAHRPRCRALSLVTIRYGPSICGRSSRTPRSSSASRHARKTTSRRCSCPSNSPPATGSCLATWSPNACRCWPPATRSSAMATTTSTTPSPASSARVSSSVISPPCSRAHPSPRVPSPTAPSSAARSAAPTSRTSSKTTRVCGFVCSRGRRRKRRVPPTAWR